MNQKEPSAPFTLEPLWPKWELLTKLNMEVIDCEPNKIAQNLIHALQVGGKECPVINQVLTNASFDCFDGRVNLQRYESARQYHKEIAVCIEELLGYLVLSLVNERDAQVVGGILGQNWEGSYFELHVQTLGGVEMFIARESKRKASFVVNGNKLAGQHAIPVSSSSFSWNANARLNDF